MTEGKIYRCTWTRIPTGYRVWLKADPSIAAEHAEFEAADGGYANVSLSGRCQ